MQDASSVEISSDTPRRRTEQRQHALWEFFLQHRTDEWFREKYALDDVSIRARKHRRRAGRQHKAQWLRELHSGALDRVNFDLQQGGDDAPMYTVTNRLGNIEHYDTDVVAIPPDTEHKLLVRSWPPDLPRRDLERHLQTFTGFRYVALLEPLVQRRWHRAGIAVFKDGTDVRAAAQALNGAQFGDFVLHLAVIDRPSISRLRIAPACVNAMSRLEHDLRMAQALVRTFEEEDSALFSAEPTCVAAQWLRVSACEAIDERCTVLKLAQLPRRDALKKRLDLHLDLLRTVYHCDFYLCLVCDLPEELEHRSACHVRRQPSDDEDVDDAGAEDTFWTTHHDEKMKLLLYPDQVLAQVGGIDVER